MVLWSSESDNEYYHITGLNDNGNDIEAIM